MKPESNAYIAKMRQLPGWLAIDDAVALCVIDQLQREVGVCGNIVELGVYRGMSLGLLATLARAEEFVFGLDLFEAARMVDVLAELGQLVDVSNVRLYKVDSAKTYTGQLYQLTGSTRLVHVDAGHEFADVHRDIGLFHASLTRLLGSVGGVLAVDDYFDGDSPGVALATAQACRDYQLTPFLCGRNKMFLCKPVDVAYYLQGLLKLEPFKSCARIQTLPSNPIIVGFPAKPHETAKMVEQVARWAAGRNSR